MNTAPPGLALPLEIELSSQFGLKLRVEETLGKDNVKLIAISLSKEGKDFAKGELQLGAAHAKISVRRSCGGLALLVQSGDSRFAARFIPAKDLTGVQVLERFHGPVERWQWQFAGSTVFTHKQLGVISMPSEKARFRMGSFTQYGQLFNLKDWMVVENGEKCAGLIGIRTGKWSHPANVLLHAQGTSTGLTMDMRWNQRQLTTRQHKSLKRSYLLLQAPTNEAITPTRLGIEYFEPTEGFASWPAKIIARYGTTRPERIAALRRTNDSIKWQRPTQFIYGDDQVLKRGMQRAARDPALGKVFPFWDGKFDEAKTHLFGEMEKFQKALHEFTFLHPWGNAVAIRPFAGLCILFHMLDFLGHITDDERKRAVWLISDLAELFLRTDLYPHDYATHAPEYPYGPDSIYRGMLNQNFNTDCYVLVGMAGCVLLQHPRAKLWRKHAVDQFETQMRAYVWPGGAWEESHTYANHVKITLLPFLWAMRFMPEKVDLIADPRFRETCRFFPRILSPKDAVADGTRAIPAVGDHGYKHGNAYNVFGWLATLCNTPNDADEALFRWTWETSGKVRAEGSEFARLLNPLLLPEAASPAPTPNLPRLQNLTGYGASFRGGKIGGDDETLLIVRCGLSWGHYHPDQGSFWWWAHGRLLCCDADLGAGELKFAHRGSSILSYPGRDPLQFLDRPNYHVDQCEPRPTGGANIRCQIPIVAWGSTQNETRIPEAQRPHDVRSYQYDGQDHLTIIDEPVNSPDGVVMWCLHVPAKVIRRDGQRRVICELDDAGDLLQIDLPTDPTLVEIKQFGATTAVFCTYPQQRLVHEVRFIPGK